MDYMRAYCYYKQSPKGELDQTNTIKAMGMMQTFINTHPGSARNKEAMRSLTFAGQNWRVKELKERSNYIMILGSLGQQVLPLRQFNE